MMRLAADGEWYTEEQFTEYYGQRGAVMWRQAREAERCSELGAASHGLSLIHI